MTSAERKAAIDARLKYLSAIEDGWYGSKSKGPTPHAIESARRFLYSVAESDLPKAFVCPLDNGGIHAEWGDSKRSHGGADIEFPPAPGPLDLYVHSYEPWADACEMSSEDETEVAAELLKWVDLLRDKDGAA